MVGEAVEKKLYDAASRGDLATFQQLLRRDPYLLDGVSFAGSRNLLHIATIWGHAAIVEEVLATNPRLARNLDSEKSSPLHMAAAEGHTEIAKKLSPVAPEMCWRRDCQGMNPIHIAAMNGHVEILEELIRLDPIPAREKVGRGETVLHLCVKHGQLEALQVLVERLVERLGDELVCAKDEEGDTILHLAVRCSQTQIIKYLVENNKIKKSIMNSKGQTANDILLDEQIPSSSEIEEILLTWSLKPPYQAFNKLREIGMVIAVLIATMAFQAVVSPPGGVWQDDSSTHRAGAAVMAYTHPKIYKHFVHVNAVAFISSLITIALLITGIASIHVMAMLAVMLTMLMSLASIAVSYGASVTVITPSYTDTQSLAHLIWIVVTVSVIIIVLLWFQIRGRGRDPS